MQPKLLLPLAAVAAVFAVPAAANAAVTITADTDAKTVAFESDAAADNITLGVNKDGLITHNIGGTPTTDFGGGRTFKSDNTLSVTVKGGGGNDTINLSGADLLASAIDGDDGDDIIVGGDPAETINGGAGNDRITGFKGDDTINGGPDN